MDSHTRSASDTGSSSIAASWRGALITAASFALVFCAVVLVWQLARPLTLLLVAIVIAQALAPVVNLFCRWLPRVLSTIIVYLIVFGIIGIGIWLVLPGFIQQGQELVAAAPEYVARGQDLLDTMDGAASERVIEAGQAAVQQFGELVLALPLGIFASIIDLVLVIFMSIYWLIATPALHRFAMSMVPASGRERAAEVLRDMGGTMGGFVRGTFIDAVIVAIIAYIGLTVIGVQFAVLLAVVQGLGEIVPIVGPIVAAIPALLVALLDSPQQALIVLVFILILQQAESNILVPLIMRNQADIPPLISITAILGGAALGGLLGALVAIPFAGAIQIFVVRVVAPAARRIVGIDDEHIDVGTEPPDLDGEGQTMTDDEVADSDGEAGNRRRRLPVVRNRDLSDA
jgi:predicted PurR-regulated permease PerM